MYIGLHASFVSTWILVQRSTPGARVTQTSFLFTGKTDFNDHRLTEGSQN